MSSFVLDSKMSKVCVQAHNVMGKKVKWKTVMIWGIAGVYTSSRGNPEKRGTCCFTTGLGNWVVGKEDFPKEGTLRSAFSQQANDTQELQFGVQIHWASLKVNDICGL